MHTQKEAFTSIRKETRLKAYQSVGRFDDKETCRLLKRYSEKIEVNKDLSRKLVTF